MVHRLVRTNAANIAFQQLVTALDKELAGRNGASNAFYMQFNKIDQIKYAVVAYADDQPVGCGGLKNYSGTVLEIKRMYVPLSLRGKGIASMILKELEAWAKELGFSKCILETGTNLPEAISLYRKSGYHQIPNYGQYANDAKSVCFEKEL